MEMLAINLIQDLPIVGKLMILLIFTGFMPLTAISFFRYMVPRKEENYKKSIDEMGIDTERKVSDTHNWTRYILPVSFITLVCFMASFYFLFAESFIDEIKDSVLLAGPYFGNANAPLMDQSVVVLSFAFLGSFLWSAGNIVLRLISSDLSPSVYYNAGLRIILAGVIALVLSFVIGEEGANSVVSVKASLPAIAMLTGMFPERVLNYLIKLYQKYVTPDSLNNEQLSLYRIEGMSMAHKERLEEIGIDNAQNLATTSLTQLCIDTPFEARQLLDWIGQAKLICYVKDEIENLRKVGIRSVFDFYKGDKSQATLNQIAQAAGVNPVLLEVVSNQVKADTGIQALYRFQTGVNSPNKSQEAEKTTGKEKVEQEATAG
ncbi:MAG: hypothetical protein AAFP19_00295 [Bacteroidota bacterium]